MHHTRKEVFFMATINASVSNFMGMTDLASRGIGTGQTINHPSIPTFLSNSGKSTGVNYASTYFQSMLNNNTLGSIVSKYDSEKSSFQSEFKQAMGDARKTGEALKNVDYRGKDAAAKTKPDNSAGGLLSTLDSQGSKPTNATSIRNKDAAVKTEENSGDRKTANVPQEDPEDKSNAIPPANEPTKTPPFPSSSDTAQKLSGLINQYNDTVDYLQSKIGMSSQFDYFAASFNNTDNLMRSMEDIGVNVEPTGTLSVDTQALTKALQEKPDSVEQALGAEGLAGKIDKSTAASDYQSGRMFPSINEALGQENDSHKGMYAQNSRIASTLRGNSGRLMDMYY